MKRYIFFLIVGGILIVGGQYFLSLGITPDSAADFPADFLGTLLRGSLGLVLGSVLAVLGLLGLADGHQRQATRLGELLSTKLPPVASSDPETGEGSSELAVSSAEDLQRNSRRFWVGYLKTAAALCLFMALTLALTASLTGTSRLFYLVVLTSGTALIGLLAALLGLPAVGSMRKVHAGILLAAEAYANQPELPAPDPDPVARPSRPWRLPRRRPMRSESRRNGRNSRREGTISRREGTISRRVSVDHPAPQVTVRHYE